MPMWLRNDSIVITRTENGYAVCETEKSLAGDCLVFETWGALAYFLDQNFANGGEPKQ